MQTGGGLYQAPMSSPGPVPGPSPVASSSLAQALMQSGGARMPAMQNPVPQIPLSTIASLAGRNADGQSLYDRLFGLGGTFGSGGYFDNLFGGGYLGTAGTGAPADQFSDAMSAGFNPFAPSTSSLTDPGDIAAHQAALNQALDAASGFSPLTFGGGLSGYLGG